MHVISYPPAPIRAFGIFVGYWWIQLAEYINGSKSFNIITTYLTDRQRDYFRQVSETKEFPANESNVT